MVKLRNACTGCNSTILFGGVKQDEMLFCNTLCLEYYLQPNFCASCLAESGDKVLGSTFMFNGIGTTLHGKASKCPNCYSVVRAKWFSFTFLPIIPLGKYRVKILANGQYMGRPLKKRGQAVLGRE